jgi:hypothetical protein
MADRLREDELYGHGRRGRMFRDKREEESGYPYGRGFGEPGETYERAFEGPGYAYGRGYGGPDASGGDYYSIYQGRALGAREPRSDYDRGLYPYSPQYGEGPRYGGGISYERRFGDFGRAHDVQREESWPERRERSFRGRGPKGYVRSDDRIREDICDRLTEDPTLDAAGIEIRVSGGDVTLSGTVDSREDKRRAEDDAEFVAGVKNVQNLLRVEEAGIRGAGEARVPERELELTEPAGRAARTPERETA